MNSVSCGTFNFSLFYLEDVNFGNHVGALAH